MSDDWRPVLTRESSVADLEDEIAGWAQTCLDDLQMELEADRDLSAGERAALLARAEPLIRQRTRVVFEAAWHQVRGEADPRATVH